MLIISRKTDVKQINKLGILKLIRNLEETTQPEISKELGLSRPTVSSLVDELIGEGFIKVSGIGTSTDQGGKRPKLIAFNSKGGAIISLHLGFRFIEAALIDLSANTLWKINKPTTKKESKSSILAKIYEMVEELNEKANTLEILVRGIGVGCPGLVETQTGKIITATNFENLHDFSLGESLFEKFQTPVWVDNECRNLVLAEKMFGDGKDIQTFVSLETDVGIGAGIIINQQIVRGIDNSFGEIGHTTIQMDGPACQCGNEGCWEVFASSNALQVKVAKNLSRTLKLKEMVESPDDLSIQLIAEAIEQGDTVVEQMAIYDLGKYLGVGIANLANTLNPELVIIHGEMSLLGDRLIEQIERHVRLRALPVPKQRMRVKFSQLGEMANLIGSGALVLKELFDNPDYLFTN
ncbi:ROK family transcriptional regulator [Ammoniphilus resinae]|uniref:NBD/HSP70 family sugar kinase n=1 Tax=Ammoniphilus resinae TaxID=861532 RepID=A0ABS4GMI2_9BACL|nr:ROK family transcriptional regulator [Ammoniphilus resinae]MBP1931317.1 putative NBD/HSP70 family sugar kinase [Ammoniphilus resinae]